MFLIRKGRPSRPVCAGCKRLDPDGEVPARGAHICTECRAIAEENRKRFEAEMRRAKRAM